ncbi:hypothetical protein TQ29_14090 [Actibacterium sp. EMB200-NS6]|nr:hypothetical protein TQ29_14090 [Actibacterium sp. EMB200-NS6]
MLLACFAFRPAGGERAITVAADHGAAKRKILIDICAGGNARAFFDAFLDACVGLERDQPFMLSLHHADAPGRDFDVTCIVRASEQSNDFFVADKSTWKTTGKGGFRFQIGLHFALRRKTPVGESI